MTLTGGIWPLFVQTSSQAYYEFSSAFEFVFFIKQRT